MPVSGRADCQGETDPAAGESDSARSCGETRTVTIDYDTHDEDDGRMTIEKVAVIRSLSSIWKLSNAEIGRRFGVPRETIRDIVNRKSWKGM